MSGFSLRLASPDDAAEIALLLRRTLNEALPYLPALHTPEEDRAFIGGRMLPTCTVWVAVTDRERNAEKEPDARLLWRRVP